MTIFFTTALVCLLSCNSKEKKYNILFIAVDDLRPELGCYGIDYVKSPHIDHLADEGVVFNRAYCSVSWCSPSRTSLLTGLRPSATGVLDLKTHFRNNLPHVITLPQFFKQHGYTSLGFGKIFHNDSSLQDEQSWTGTCWIPPGPSPILAYATNANIEQAMSNPYLKSQATEKAEVTDDAYPDGQVTEEALSALKNLRDSSKPFFLAVGFYKPHLPFTAPAKYWDLYEEDQIPLSDRPDPVTDAPPYMFRTWSETGSYANIPEEVPYSDSLSRHLKHGYLACISYVDAQIGRLIGALKSMGLYDNTIIVIWGDHGWKLGDYTRWSKHSNMEIDTRVPLIIKAPDQQPREMNNIVESIDLYPTLVRLTGFENELNVHGENLFSKKRNYAISQIPRDSVIGYSIRTEDYRYIEWSLKGSQEPLEFELYDHRQNHDELVNIASDPANSLVLDRFRLLREELGDN